MIESNRSAQGTAMRLFHRTAAADEILTGGFRDGEGSYMLVGLILRGVFLSDVPLDVNEGTQGNDLLEVLLPCDLGIDDFEIVEDGRPYREWCVPASLLNEWATLRFMSPTEEDDWHRDVAED